MALSRQTQRGRRNHLPSPAIRRLFEGRCDGGDVRIQAAAQARMTGLSSQGKNTAGQSSGTSRDRLKP
jgi:hypothetical protein